jgi:RNA polymerase sigma-70 factor (ECF subfamily)
LQDSPPDELKPQDAARDEWLVLGCQLGDRDAFDALIARWHPPLWRYLARAAGDADRAADMSQDVWVRVISALPRLREPAKFRGWLFGIARRVAMDRLRTKYATPVFEAKELDELAETATADDREVDIERMEAELQRLPPVERDVLVLFYLRELSLADIAAATEIPVGTVKSRLHRARHLLRAQMAATGEQS